MPSVALFSCTLVVQEMGKKYFLLKICIEVSSRLQYSSSIHAGTAAEIEPVNNDISMIVQHCVERRFDNLDSNPKITLPYRQDPGHVLCFRLHQSVSHHHNASTQYYIYSIVASRNSGVVSIVQTTRSTHPGVIFLAFRSVVTFWTSRDNSYELSFGDSNIAQYTQRYCRVPCPTRLDEIISDALFFKVTPDGDRLEVDAMFRRTTADWRLSNWTKRWRVDQRFNNFKNLLYAGRSESSLDVRWRSPFERVQFAKSPDILTDEWITNDTSLKEKASTATLQNVLFGAQTQFFS